jgi:hypothetical protein
LFKHTIITFSEGYRPVDDAAERDLPTISDDNKSTMSPSLDSFLGQRLQGLDYYTIAVVDCHLGCCLLASQLLNNNSILGFQVSREAPLIVRAEWITYI